jgi:hypothetical protein
MAERPLRSEDELALERLRQAYEQLEPPDALLRRVQRRLAAPLETAPRRGGGGRLRRSVRLGVALAAVALSAAAAWGLWNQARTPERPAPAPTEPRPSAPRPPPEAPRAEPRRGVPAAPPVQGPAGSFFELPDARGLHSAKGATACTGTWDEAAVFPRLGFSAQPVIEAFAGSHACSVRWQPAAGRSEALPGALTLSVQRSSAPIVACASDRGLRVPLRIEVDGLAGAPVSGEGSLLMQSQDHYALSFRRRQQRSLDGEGPGGAGGRSEIFSLLISATGPLAELRRHGSWTASIVARETLEGRSPRWRTGELSCWRAP